MKNSKKEACVPLVTIAIPTFNRIELLKRAVGSVLMQNYKNLEIIVSDNNSSDGTCEYLKSILDPRVKFYLGDRNIGMVLNWDRCLKMASGEYFILMSDDDAFFNDRAIEKLVSGFLCNPLGGIGAVFSDVRIERLDKNFIENTFANKNYYFAEELVVDFFSSKVTIFPCATLFRTNDIRDFGGYSSFGAKLAVDACALIVVAFKYGKIIRVAEPLVTYRFHQSLSSSSVEILSADWEVMNKLIEKYKNKISQKQYKTIKNVMRSAWSRIPIGYIIRKYREDSDYKKSSLIFDLIKYRRIFTFGNLYTIICRLFRLKKF